MEQINNLIAEGIQKAGSPQQYLDSVMNYMSQNTDFFKNKEESKHLVDSTYSKHLTKTLKINSPRRFLILGASGRVGSKVVDELKKIQKGEKNNDFQLILATRNSEKTKQWKEEGFEVVNVDLNKPEDFDKILTNIDSVFLLTGYTLEMIIQSKNFIDACAKANVSHIVHLGVFNGKRDVFPHFNWHAMIEKYISSTGISWTCIHPNVIWNPEEILNATNTGKFYDAFDGKKQGYCCAIDIGAVTATVLAEGPEKHNHKDYYLSIELLTVDDIVKQLSEIFHKEITYDKFKYENFYITQLKYIIN